MTTLATHARTLATEADRLSFASPVTHVYNPLAYAWEAHAAYLERYGTGTKRVVMVGMNPGPWGMAQTGIPFGEISYVRDWMGIRTPVGKPGREHPKRPIHGFDCARSEVSGRRLWGLFAERFDTAERFFNEHFVINYCPLVFMAESGRNITPDKLPASEVAPLTAHCDRHLLRAVELLQPEWVIGVGAYAGRRIRDLLGERVRVGRVLHPSPASPAANHDWAGTVTRQLTELGVWAPS